MKENIQDIKQHTRVIQATRLNQEITFEDNRTNPMQEVIQEMKPRGKKKTPSEDPVLKSLKNLACYSPDKYKEICNNRTDEDVMILMTHFVDYHKSGIRGHASKSAGFKQNKQTTEDLKVFKEWWKKNKEYY